MVGFSGQIADWYWAKTKEVEGVQQFCSLWKPTNINHVLFSVSWQTSYGTASKNHWGGIGCHLTCRRFTSPGCLCQAVATIISLFFTQSLLGVSGLLEIKWQLSINSPNPPESLYKLLLFLQKWQVLPRPKDSSRTDGQAEQVKTWVATFHLPNCIVSFEDTLK
jgi:hypothetical protein